MRPLPCLFALSLGFAPLAATAAGQNTPAPPGPARYVITVAGRDIGPFQELGGMDTSAKAKPPSFVLKRGPGADVSLQAWRGQVLAGDPLAHKPAVLRAVGPDGTVVATWTLRACWPSKLDIASKTAGPAAATNATVQMTCGSVQKTG